MKKYLIIFVKSVIENPKLTLGLSILLTFLFALGLPKIQFDSSLEFLMPREDPAYKLGERANKAFLNNKTFIITSIEPAKGEKLFSENVFVHINEAVKEIEEYKTFNRSVEDTRLQTIIDLGGATIKEKAPPKEENVKQPAQKQKNTGEGEENLEAQLDELIFSEEGKSGEKDVSSKDIDKILDESAGEADDVWNLEKPLSEDRFVKPIRPKRNYSFKDYTPVSLSEIRQALDPMGQKQLDTVILARAIKTENENVKLTKPQYKQLLMAWEDIYLYKSMEIVQSFMNPITGEDITGENEELKPVDFVKSDENGNKLLPKTEADFKKYVERIRLNPLNKEIFYSEDENGNIRALSMNIVLRSLEHYINFIDLFWPILDKYDTGPVKLNSLGSLVIEKFMSDFMRTDLQIYIPLVLLLVIVTFYLNFRSIRGVVLPTLTVVIGAIWTMGLMGHLGFKMSMLVSILPPLLIAIGSSYSIHIFNQYLVDLEALHEGDREKKLITAMSHISLTVLLAAFTTFISFMTLSVSQVTSLRDFGIFAATGALFSMITAGLLIPSSLILMKDLPHNKLITALPLSHRIVQKLLTLFAHLSINKSKLVMIVCGVLFAFGAFGLTLVKPETSPMLNFMEDSYIRTSDNRLNTLFNGTFSLNLIIDSGEKNGAKDPEFLEYIEGIRKWLRQPEQKENYSILGDSSFGDFIKRMNMAMHDDDPRFFSIPKNKSTVADYLEIFSGEDTNSDGRPDGFEQFVDNDYRRVNLVIRTGSYKDRLFTTKINEEIQDHVLEYMKSVDNPKNYEYFMVGSGINIIVLAQYILEGQITSVLLSLLIIAVLIFLLFKNIAASFLSIIPITMGITIVYGLMGYFDIPLDIPKVILSSIAIGIGIDDTIHFMKTLAHNMSKGITLDKALEETFADAGVAIVYTSIALVFGFSILTLSNFRPIFFLGMLVASVMSATTIGALLFLPAFIKSMNLRMKDIDANGDE